MVSSNVVLVVVCGFWEVYWSVGCMQGILGVFNFDESVCVLSMEFWVA